MAALKQVVKDNYGILIEGIAWLAIYKRKNSWECKVFYPDGGDYETGYRFCKEDIEQMQQIILTDPKAICINGYYMSYGPELNKAATEVKILSQYTERRNQLQTDFMEGFVIT